MANTPVVSSIINRHWSNENTYYTITLMGKDGRLAKAETIVCRIEEGLNVIKQKEYILLVTQNTELLLQNKILKQLLTLIKKGPSGH